MPEPASDSVAKIATALASAQAEIEGAHKDSENPHFRSRYADLASVVAACRPLSAHGIAFVQMPRAEGGRCYVRTILIHTSGESLASELSVKMDKETVQTLCSCITYLRRYGLMAMAGIAPEDDDGEGAMNRTKPARPRKARKPKPSERFDKMVPEELEVYIAKASRAMLNNAALKDAIKAIEDDECQKTVRGRWELRRSELSKRATADQLAPMPKRCKCGHNIEGNCDVCVPAQI